MHTLGQFYTGFSGVAVGIKSGENVVLYIIMLMINGLLDRNSIFWGTDPPSPPS